MENIKIYNAEETESVMMPRTRSIEVGGEQVYTETTMISGKLVRDIKGYRTVVNASWEWLPAATLQKVHTYLRSCKYLKVEYPDPVLGDTTRYFSISYPTSKVFKFIDGEPRWYGVEIEMQAQEIQK